VRAEVTFAVVLEMQEDAAPPESKAARRGVSFALSLVQLRYTQPLTSLTEQDYPAEWIPAETRHTSERDEGKRPEEDEYQSTISPVHGVRLGMLSVRQLSLLASMWILD